MLLPEECLPEDLTWGVWCYLELLFKAQDSLPTSGGQYFGEGVGSVCLGHRRRKNYSVGIIKSEFQE